MYLHIPPWAPHTYDFVVLAHPRKILLLVLQIGKAKYLSAPLRIRRGVQIVRASGLLRYSEQHVSNAMQASGSESETAAYMCVSSSLERMLRVLLPGQLAELSSYNGRLRSGVRFSAATTNISLLHSVPDRHWGPPILIDWVPGALSPVAKQVGHGPHNWPPSIYIVPRSRMMELYLHSLIRHHVVPNESSTGRGLLSARLSP
jgi:hypothetical protein